MVPASIRVEFEVKVLEKISAISDEHMAISLFGRIRGGQVDTVCKSMHSLPIFSVYADDVHRNISPFHVLYVTAES